MKNLKNSIILAVDDDYTTLTYIEKILVKQNYKVIFAKNSEEALIKAKEHLPDAILLDILLPETNGIQVLKELVVEELTKDIPVIIVSIKDDDETLKTSLEVGAIDYIKKPISPIELQARLKNALRLKNKENMIKEAEIKYKQLIENANDGIILSKAETGFIMNANKKASELTGLPLDRLIGTKQENLHPEKDNSVYMDYFYEIKENNRPLTKETLIVNHSTKEEIPIEISVNILHTGGEMLIQSILRDMREHKENEKMLEESEALYKAIVEDQTEMICRYNTNFKLTFINNAYCRYFNIKENTFIGESIFHNIKREYIPDMKKKLKSLTVEKPSVTFEYQVLRSITSKPRWIKRTDRAIFNNENRIIEYQAIARDVTVNKLYKEELINKYEFISYIAEMSPAGILSVNKEGRITFHNKNSEELFGFSDNSRAFSRYFNELKLYNISNGTPVKDKQNPFNIIIRTKKHLFNAQYLIKKDENNIYISINGATIKDKNDKIDSIIFSINNISRQKDFERKLQEKSRLVQQANDELQALSYSLSHDLKNSVSNIRIATEFLKNHYSDKLDDDGKSVIESIYEVNNYMNELINGILNLFVLTKKDIDYKKVNISTISQSIVDKLKKYSPERHIEEEIESNIIVKGDSNMIKVMIENLIYNAWKFTQKNNISRIKVGKTTQDGQKVIFVQDNGIGFDTNKYSDKIFSSFYRIKKSDDKYKGSGIGLSTVKKIIEKHKGDIWVESEPNIGTTFYFTIPD